MKLLKVDELTGKEVLARPIMMEGYKELLSEGITIKKEYIPKLKLLGIDEIYVKDRIADVETLAIIKEDTTKVYKEKVQKIISMHTYNGNNDMLEISKTADNIITDIMEDDNVAEQVFDIKERSADVYEHCISTCTIATLVALKMGLPKEQVYDISVGCLLHELGLRYIVMEFDNIDIDQMPQNEYEEFKKHPLYGYEAVKTYNWISKDSKEILLCHHENMDGSGYPLHTANLSMPVRIASVCDFFDEHICGIGCKRMKVYEVVEVLKCKKGITFDKDVVDNLLDFIAVYPSGSEVITSDGEKAVVIKQNKGFPERPVIQVVSDKEGNAIEEVVVKDLLKNNSLFIDKVLN